MEKEPLMNDMRPKFARLMPTMLILLPLLLAASCGDNKGKIRERPIYTKIATTVLPLNHPLIETLGKLEGPYTFTSADSPVSVKLIDAKGQFETFIMLGLRADEYPPPKDPVDTESQAARDAEIRERPELYAFKQKGLKEVFGDEPVWVLRLSTQKPSLTYIFKPEKPPVKDKEALVGPGILLNAEVLRKGLTTMELEGVDHPFYGMMLDAQLAAIVEARRKPGNNANIWNAFHLRVPESQEDGIEEMENRL